MRKFQCLLFMLNRSYICYYIICMTVPLTLAFGMAVLYRNDAFSIIVISTKKRYSSLLKKIFFFQKISFKVKVLKTFNISTDYHIKTCRSLKRRTILKIPTVSFFRRIFALSVGFKMKPLRKKVFQCSDKNQLKFCRKTC